MVVQLHATSPDTFGILENSIIVFLSTLFITGFFAFTGFAMPTYRLFPRGYYRVRFPELLHFWYRYLGGAPFRIFLKIFFWGPNNTKMRFFNGRRDDIPRMIRVTKQSEFSHLLAFIFILVFSFDMLFLGFTWIFWGTMGVNVIGNLYPVLLQRIHRERIPRVLPPGNGL